MPLSETTRPASPPQGGPALHPTHGHGHGHGHAQAGEGAEARPALRLVDGSGPAAPTLVRLSPSLMRMGAAGRLAVAGGLVLLVWGATLAVTA